MKRQRRYVMRSPGHLSRDVMIHICKDGTISYRTREQKVFNGVALPIFSVDTIEQAKAIQVRYGRRQYHEHDLIPGEPWYRWTNFSGELDELDGITEELNRWWEGEKAAGRV